MCKKLMYLVCFVLVLGPVLMDSYAEASLIDGVVAYWPFDDNADDSVGANNGTLVGNASYVDGKLGKAVSTSAVGSEEDYVLFDTTSDGLTGAWTAAAWIYVHGLDIGAFIDGYFGDPADDECYSLRLPGQYHATSNPGMSSYVTNFNVQWDGIVSQTQAYETPVGTWTLMVFVGSDTQCELFADGVSQGTIVYAEAGTLGEFKLTWDRLGSYEKYPSYGAAEVDFDELAIWDRALTQEEVLELWNNGDGTALNWEVASGPTPKNRATEVPRDVVLSWTPGEFTAAVNGHTVYLSENFNDVNDGVGGITQSSASYDPGRLKFGTTYYWRVDEISASPASTVYPGEVWSLKTELVAYQIENVIAMASSSSVDEGVENTVNGSGLDVNDLHSTDPQAMWLSEAGDPGSASIQYEFDKSCKLHEMLVWNYNGDSLLALYGLKEVTIEYSTDGTNFSQLENVPEFAQAIGGKDYAANTTVAFNGAAVKYVKITANSNWGGGGGFFNQYGLSEVRFTAIPVSARKPSPDSGATGVDVDVILGWKAGREAASHDVYVSADPNALILAGPVTEPAFDTASLDLALSQTYHWRVDEVNEAETITTWQGDLWSFTTQEYRVVDDFESYNDLNPDDPESNRIFLTWIGGDDDPDNGSQVGHDTFPFAEQFFVHGGEQSMPLYYNNTIASFSEATVNTDDLVIGRDWTKGAPGTLILWIYGDPNNAATEQLYVKIGDTRFDYTGDAADLTRPIWSEWPIDLTDIDLSNVPTFVIGFERTGAGGGAGIVYIDDIALYPQQSVSPIGITIPVPNGDFEQLYKPGSDTITADLGEGWTQGLGPDTLMDDGIATYSDGTTGDLVDIPGWIGADPQGWIDNGGTYDRDTSFPNRQGSVARQSVTPYGLYYYLSNGGGWGNAAGGLIVSDAPLATVEDGLTYTLSMLANGGATPVVLDLLADGVALTPSSSVDPELSDDWQEVSRTYDAADLAGYLDMSLTIRLGVGRGASGGQSHFDAVSLSYVP